MSIFGGSKPSKADDDRTVEQVRTGEAINSNNPKNAQDVLDAWKKSYDD